MPFDIAGARQAGYSDDEIAGHLASQSGFDLGGATKAGYSTAEVIEFLARPTTPKPVSDDSADESGVTPSTPRSAQATFTVSTGPSGAERVAKELGQLRDEAFSGVDQGIAGVKNINAAAMAKRMQDTQARIQELERRGRGESSAARQLRNEVKSLQERLPVEVQGAAEASATAQRGSQMATRPAVQKVAAAKTLGEAWDAFKEAPYDVIAGVTAQSLPQMLPALVVAATAGPGAGAAAMGVSSGAVEFGSSLSDFAREAGVNTGDPKALEAFYTDPQKLQEGLAYAGKRAGIIGTLDAVSGGIAGKTLAPPIRSKIVRQAVNMPVQMGVQAAAGAGGEAGAQLATKGEIAEPGQVLLEAVGELGGAPAEVAAFTREAAGRAPAPAPIPSAEDMVRQRFGPRPAAPAPADPIPPIMQAPTVDSAIAAAQAAVAAPNDAAAAVDNIARILGQETTDAGQPAAVPAVPAGGPGAGSSDAAAGVAVGAGRPAAVGAVDAGGVAGTPAAQAAPLGAAGAGAVAPADPAAAASASLQQVTVNPSGTVTAIGDPLALGKLLKAAGVKNVLQAKNGLVVGRSEAQAALQVLQDFQAAPPAGTSAVPGSPQNVPAAAVKDGADGVAARLGTADAVTAPTAESAAVTGKTIDKEWTAFSSDSGTLNVPRAEMPQIKAEHRGAMVNFLNARDITHSQEEVPANSLKPTQAEFSPGKVAKAKGYTGTDRSILVSADSHVLDGHHQWMAKLETGEPVKVIRLDAPINQLLETVKEFPSAEVARGATPQSAQATAEEAPAQARGAEQPQPLDHGELNIPGRTNRIDAELDRFKSDQVKAKKAEAKKLAAQRQSDKTRAKELFVKHWPAMKERMGARFGEKALRDLLDSMVKWEPAKFVALAEKFQKEQAARENESAQARDDTAQRRSDGPMPSGLTLDEARAQIKALRGASVAAARAIVDEMTAGWKNGPRITVVETAADLPGDNPSDVRGLYTRGHIYIVARAHRNGKDLRRTIARTLAHEAVAHFGLRDMLGREGWYQLMRNIQLGIKAGNKALREIQAYVREVYTDADGNVYLQPDAEADEIAARAVELAIDEQGNFRPGFGFLKSVWARVAQFLRDHGIRVSFSNAELQGMLVLSMRNLQAGERTAGGGQLAVAAAREDGPMHHRAFHGSPHDFDSFSTDAIGSGEGNQSFGWGLYFAENKGIAEGYRQNLSYREIVRQFRDALPDDASLDEALDAAESGELSKPMADVIEALAADDWLGFDYPAQAITAAFRDLDNYDASPALREAVQKYGGRLYQVEIPDELVGRMLLWDKPLSEQPDAVRDAVDDAIRTVPGISGTLIERFEREGQYWTGEEIYRFLAGRQVSLYGDRGASEHLAEHGIPGIKYLDGGSRADGDGTHNLVVFHDHDVTLTHKDGTPVTSVERDDFLEGAHARGAATTGNQPAAPAQPAQPPTSPWRDATGRLQFAPGAWLYEKLGAAAGPLLSKLQLKAADPKLRRALREMKLQVAKAQETAAAVAGEAMKLSEAERAMVSDLIEKELAAGTIPPAHAVRLAAMINTTMGAQTDELVRLGMLTAESADMWRDKYLPRFYQSKLKKQVGDAWADAMQGILGRQKVMAGIKGKHLRGRGLFENVPVADIPAWEAQGWEVRDPEYEDFLANPGNYQTGWTAANRDVQMWRDFTRQERDAMGEIRDAGFRFVMGYMQTQRDIALGQMFEQLAGDATMSAKKESSEFSVHVPDGTVPGTGAKRYGKLAGRWVSKDTMSHLSQIEEAQSDAWRMYRKALAIWKEGKTALNPVSHVNNVLSNLTMAHFAGVSYWDANKYLAAARDFATKAAGVTEATDAGLFLGTMSDAELMNVLPEDLKALVKQQDSAATKVGRSAFNVMTFFLRRPMGWAYQAEDTFFRYLIYRDARQQGLAPADAVDYAQKYIFSYDDLPKGARLVRDFAIPFVSYTYKAVPALLHTALAHPLRFSAPAAVLWAANAAAYAIAAGDDEDDWDEKLRKYLTDADYRQRTREKERLEREHLPPWMKGKTALATPKAIRLGSDELTKLPVFIDTARIVPGGDVFDVSPNAGGIPLPQPITPSNPLFTTAVAMLANKDMFFGKDLVDANDTRGEAAAKRADWIWKQFSPAITLGNYHWERGMQALAQATGGEVRWLPEGIAPDAVATGIGRDGNPVQPKYAAMQTFGIKARPIDLDMAEKIEASTRDKMIRDIEAEMSKLQRLNQKGAISDSAMERERERSKVKKGRLSEGLTVDGEKKD